MAETAFSGPVVVFGQSPLPGQEYNPDIGTSLFYAGAAILDPRQPFTYFSGEAQSQVDSGWLGFDNITTLAAVPYTASNAAIVASANPTGPTLTLVSASSATTGVYITNSFVRSDTGVIDTNGGLGLVALDAYVSVTASFSNGVMTVTSNTGQPIGPWMVVISTTGTVTQGAVGLNAIGSGYFGSGPTYVYNQLTTTGATPVGQGYAGTYQCTGNLTATSGTVVLAYPNVQTCMVPTNLQTPTVGLWSPMALLGRVVNVTAAAGATYTTATISGYDVYGYPMVEAITITAGATVAGNKAFKYIKSVVLSGGTADTTHTYSVGTTNVIGLPMRADSSAELSVYAGASQTSLTQNLTFAANGFKPADRTVATATTGDVRGTIDVSAAAGVNLAPLTATNKYVVKQSPMPYNIQSAIGLYGVTQYSNF